MKVLLIDSGGRGHALAWKICQSPRLSKLFVAPGNGGTQQLGENVPFKVTDVDGLLKFAKANKIDFTIASQDDSLALGIVDVFQTDGLKIFGPTQAAAQIEASKSFAKKAMVRACVPTARFRTFTSCAAAVDYVKLRGAPIVVKASGLALGKGAYVCKTVEEAEIAINEIMVKRVHGDAGNVVVIEEFLEGPEVSIHALCDGKDFVMFPSAQDHKPALDGDIGKNTGGMGTIAPLPWVSFEMMEGVARTIVWPILKELSASGNPFVGCLYPGLKITKEGPKVLEFNARPGDPEIQSYVRLMDFDLLEILEACAEGTLVKVKDKVKWHKGSAATIVLASGGYPDAYKKGLPISGIKEAEKISGAVVFHAGTAVNNGVLVTSGGRVLGVTATCGNLRQALAKAYCAASYISFEGKQLRGDIGANSLAMTTI